jgi:2-haloacid dehalogenase
MMIKTIIYDLGGVLIDWNPLYVYEDYFEREADRTYFFEHICTSAWNEDQDGGRTIAEANKILIEQYPEWEKAILDYYGRWTEMIKGPIQDSVDLLAEIKKSGNYQLLALTNWSAETFPYARQRFEFLSWFEGILVSGEESTRKPHVDFYQKLVDKYNISKEKAIFIDDNIRNVEAAKAFGLKSIQFKDAGSLRTILKEMHII